MIVTFCYSVLLYYHNRVEWRNIIVPYKVYDLCFWSPSGTDARYYIRLHGPHSYDIMLDVTHRF